MKIAVDLRPLQTPSRQRGIGYFTFNLNKALLGENPKSFDFVFFTTFLNPQFILNLRKSDSFYKIPTLFWPKRGLRRLDPLMKFFWDYAFKKNKPDLLHISSPFEVYYLNFPDIKTVVTLHDLIPLKMENYFQNQKAKEWYEKRLKQIKMADKIITISEASKKDIVDILNIPEKKVAVIYGGVDESFKQVNKKMAKKYLKNNFQINTPFILSVGAFSAHKNLPRIFEAFKNYIKNNENLKLVMVCKLIPQEYSELQKRIKKLGLEGKVILTNFVNDFEMSYFYCGAEVLIFPSLYEGLGLPILEAFACGCPVITSSISSMPEIGGEAAYYVDPLNVGDITKGIKEVVENKKHQQIMIKKGLQQVRKFTWKKTARETLKIYSEVLAA